MKLQIFFIVTVTLYSCNSFSNNDGELMSTDTIPIVSDIPKRFLDSKYFTNIRKEKLEAKLKLKPLQKGFDSLQIRIWIDCNAKGNLIVIERAEQIWRARFYFFSVYYDDEHPWDLVDSSIRIEEKNPVSGWWHFSKGLIDSGIVTIPDYFTYPNLVFPTDADGIIVEIATIKTYRIYEYIALDFNSRLADGPQKLSECLNLIEREFKYKRPCGEVNIEK